MSGMLKWMSRWEKTTAPAFPADGGSGSVAKRWRGKTVLIRQGADCEGYKVRVDDAQLPGWYLFIFSKMRKSARGRASCQKNLFEI